MGGRVGAWAGADASSLEPHSLRGVTKPPMSSELPAPRRTLDIEMPDGAHIVARVHGNPKGDRLMMSHGNGFAIDAYAPFWQRFTDEFEVVVYDLRNHGRNPRFGSPGHHIEGFVGDLDHLLAEIPARLGERRTAGLYHSVSGITAMTHAVTLNHGKPFPWDALVLFDPPFVPSAGHELHEMAQTMELLLANWAMARPNHFDSPEALAKQFGSARGLSRWIAGAHGAMARAVLCEDGEGGWQLACPRELEAAAYVANAYSRLWSLLPRLTAHAEKVLLVCSDPDIKDARSPAFAGKAAAETFGLQRVAIPETTHLLQIEKPEACARAACDFLKRLGFGGAA